MKMKDSSGRWTGPTAWGGPKLLCLEKKSILVSCCEKAPNALEAEEAVLTKTRESGWG